MYNPNSEIRLIKNLSLDNSYEHTLYFESKEEQINYFYNKADKVFSNYNLVKDGSIKVKGNIGEFYNYSYMMFRNSNFSNKWFYAFINEVKYINENTTEITFEVDVIQTWLFDIEWLDSYIEREHTKTDHFGEHILEENLEIGTPVVMESRDTESIKDLCYIVVSTVDRDGVIQSGGEYSGVFSGLGYFGSTDIQYVKDFIHDLDETGKADGIICIFSIPKSLVGETDSINKLKESTGGYFVEEGTNKYYNTLDGYIPKNNKLYSYPYNYLEISDNRGNIKIYKYEEFNSEFCEFFITGNIAPNPTVFLIPKEYNNKVLNEEEIMTLSDYPLSAWSSDVYSNWLAQNQISNNLSIAGSLFSTGVGVVTGNPIAIGSGILSVANTIGNFKEMSIYPPRTHGQTTGGGNIARGSQVFTINCKTLRKEYAKILDDFFTQFGYKVLRKGKISLKNRESFTYIKTIENNFVGNFDNITKNKIKTIFNNGITFWVNHENIGNYDISNEPIDGGDTGGIENPEPTEPTTEENFNLILLEAEKHLGKPYVMGGNGPDEFDCSGFTKYVFEHALGIELPRTAQDQYNQSQKINKFERQKGDLVFFKGTYDTGDGRVVTHVGIYTGNNQMLHAGSKGIGYTNLGASYWQQHFYSYGRVV